MLKTLKAKKPQLHLIKPYLLPVGTLLAASALAWTIVTGGVPSLLAATFAAANDVHSSIPAPSEAFFRALVVLAAGFLLVGLVLWAAWHILASAADRLLARTHTRTGPGTGGGPEIVLRIRGDADHETLLRFLDRHIENVKAFRG